MFKPMLAGKCSNTKNLSYPVLASPKLDGVRAIVVEGVVMSRNMKPIPNAHVQALFGKHSLNGFDGELIVGAPTSVDCYRATASGVMAVDGAPDVTLHVFDVVGFDAPYIDRCQHFTKYLNGRMQGIAGASPAIPVVQTLINDEAALMAYEQAALELGYEGVMLRSRAGKYKEGRSTEREGTLLKLKRFEDSEALVLGYEELMHNGNAATVDALGRTARTSHKANKTGKGALGALVCRAAGGTIGTGANSGAVFNIGTGFNDAERGALWAARDTLAGKYVKYRYFPTGSKQAPRFPVFLGFRDKIDFGGA